MTKRISGGFDLRMRTDLQKEDPCQVDQYIVPNNRNPISADPSVWLRTDGVEEFLFNNRVSYPLGLFSSLEELMDDLRGRGVSTVDQTPVSLTISEVVAERLWGKYGSEYFKDAPSDISLLSCGWRFLGFDTVELNGLTSGLKGIGYKEPSWSQLRARYGDALNEVGLFSDEAKAAEFAKAREIEIPSHAPFDVVGVLVRNPSSRLSEARGDKVQTIADSDLFAFPPDPTL